MLPKNSKPTSCGAGGTRAFVIVITMFVMSVVLRFVVVKHVKFEIVLVEDVVIKGRDTGRFLSVEMLVVNGGNSCIRSSSCGNVVLLLSEIAASVPNTKCKRIVKRQTCYHGRILMN